MPSYVLLAEPRRRALYCFTFLTSLTFFLSESEVASTKGVDCVRVVWDGAGFIVLTRLTFGKGVVSVFEGAIGAAAANFLCGFGSGDG